MSLLIISIRMVYSDKVKLLFTIFATLILIFPFSQQYTSGKIITLDLDTVACEFLKSSKKSLRSNPDQIQILDSLLQPILYNPSQIGGYIRDGILFKSITIDNQHIFIRRLVDGEVLLYSYEGPSGNKYFFKKRSEAYLNILNEGNHTVRRILGASNGAQKTDLNSSPTFDIPIIEKNRAFMNYFIEYFKDCRMLVNKLRAEFYTSADMKDIFSDYNGYCVKK